jgi:N-dimethylarginine dimethylaminohydrolase
MRTSPAAIIHKNTRNGHSRVSGKGRNALSGNGHSRQASAFVAEPAFPESVIPERPVSQWNHPNGFAVRLVESAPKTFTFQIGIDREQLQPKPVSPWQNPTQLEQPAFLMNFPFSYTTDVANNPWMEDLEGGKRQPDFTRAAVQFQQVYRSISAEGLVYLLPTPPGVSLQDLLYTANLGIVLEHLPDKRTVIVSNFASPPRRGETPVGMKFFQSMGYDVFVPPFKFEGEAELKHLYDNVYVGGYGIRSEKRTYEWMEENFDMRIIKLREVEPYLYHLDCSIFPITKQNTLVCTELLKRSELAQLEKVTSIIPVSVDEAFSGICNSVRLPKEVLNSSHIHELKAGTEDYDREKQKNRRLEDIAGGLALEVGYFNLSEFHKSGALLSCMVMHLNRHSYKIALTA